jgi:hypothetical protein
MLSQYGMMEEENLPELIVRPSHPKPRPLDIKDWYIVPMFIALGVSKYDEEREELAMKDLLEMWQLIFCFLGYRVCTLNPFPLIQTQTRTCVSGKNTNTNKDHPTQYVLFIYPFSHQVFSYVGRVTGSTFSACMCHMKILMALAVCLL